MIRFGYRVGFHGRVRLVLSAEKESSGEECEEGGERDGRTKGRREVRGRASEGGTVVNGVH